jgi:olefin beta-lactone synthetase
MNLLLPFLTQGSVRSARTAIIAADGSTASYGDLMERSARLAGAWRRKGIGAGDRVQLAMPLGISIYVSLVALWRLGAVIVFPEPALGLRGLRHAVAATRPKAFLASGWFRGLRCVLPELWSVPVMITPDERGGDADGIEPVAADHPALISFTSGSTGRSKTIVRSHGFLASQNACIADLLKPQRDDETDLVAFPVFVLANLGLGVTSVLPNWDLRRHDTADARCIAEHVARNRVTRALAPPSICEKLASGPKVSLQAIFTGGGPVFPDFLERLAANAPRADIVSVYGSTEAEPIAHQRVCDITASDWGAMRTGAGLLAGHPTPALKLKIRDDEIVVTGQHVNKSYLDRADDRATKLALDGEVWHRTGDAGRVDDAGRLWLLGRLDGRANGLFPFGIEAAARFWPDVVRAALVSIDGQAVLAIEGDTRSRNVWQREADRIGQVRVVPAKSIPLDRRHRSKIDYVALRKMLGVPRIRVDHRVSRFVERRIGQHHRHFDLSIRDAPIGLEQHGLARGRDQLEAMALVEADSPVCGGPGAYQHAPPAQAPQTPT